MGVLACARRGCDHIMCDRNSTRHGYICNSCFDELVATGPTTNIQEFMESRKPEYTDAQEAMGRYSAAFPVTHADDDNDY